MKLVIIVQARMASTRLPGKIIKPVLGKPILSHQIDRLKRIPGNFPIVVATSDLSIDAPVVTWAEQLGLDIFRGSEQDVLSRFYGAASAFAADVIVRITGDCPLIDPVVSSQVIERYLQSQLCDYASNVLLRSYPIGLDTEVFSFGSLEAAYREASHPEQREHVTPFINRQPQRFKLEHVTQKEDLSQLRWTLDTPEDLAFVTAVYEALYPRKPAFDMSDVLDLLSVRPELAALNADVAQKKLSL